MATGDVGNLRVNLSLDSGSFTKNIADANRRLKLLDSDLKAADAGFGTFGNSMDQLRSKSNNLTQQFTIQQGKVSELKRRYDELARAKGEDSKEAENMLIRYRKSYAQMQKVQQALEGVNHQIEQQSNKWNMLGKKAQDAGQRMQDFGGRAQAAGSGMAASFGAATLAVGAGLGMATKKSMDFEAQLSSIKALTGASSDEMTKMRDLAMDMGSKTKYSSLEAAEGIEELLKAGLTPAQIQAGGLQQALSLATAGGLDLAKAAEIMSTGLNTFKKDGMAAADAANILAGTANASATSVEELQYGLAAVGTVADGVGLNFEDTNAALGVFANNGLKGSDAGTSLKTMLANLQPTTKGAREALFDLGIMTEDGANKFFKANGEIQDMSTLAGLLHDSMKDLTSQQRASTLQTIFGSDAVRAGNILYKEGSKGITDFKKAMGNVTAEEVATEKMNNLKGEIEQLKGSFETLQISVGHALEPIVKVGVSGLQKIVDGFNNLSPGMQRTIALSGAVATGILGIVTVGGVLLSFVGTASIGLGALTTGMGAMGIAAGGAAGGVGLLGGALAVVTGPIGLTVAAVAALTAGGIALYKNWDTVNNTLNKNPFAKALVYMNPVSGALMGVVGGIKKVQSVMDETIPKADLFGEGVSKGTQKAVNAYMKLDNDASMSLTNMFAKQQVITDSNMNTLVGKYDAMGSKILASLDSRNTQQLAKTQKLFSDSAALTDAEEAKILAGMDQDNEAKRAKVQGYEDKIKSILNKAKDEKRSLTESERITINGIQEQMRVTAVQTMSKSEAEQKMILGRLENEASKITARQAAKVVQNSLKQKNESVAHATKQYKDTVKQIEYMRDVTGTITADQARKLIKEAKKSRDESVSAATDMHNKVVKEAKKQAKGHADQIDWETGKVKTGWDKMTEKVKKGMDWLNDLFGVKSSSKSSTTHKKGDNSGGYDVNAGGRATGTPNGKHPGGWAWTSEQGRELIHEPSKGTYLSGSNGPELRKLEPGSSVLPNHRTEQVLKKYGFAGKLPAYATGVGDYFDKITEGPEAMWDLALSKVGGLTDKVLPDWFTKRSGSPLTYVKNLAKDKVQGLIDSWMSMFGSDGEGTSGVVGPGSGYGGMQPYVEKWYNLVKNRFGKTHFMGGYNNRNVRGGSSKSMHAFGQAFDIGGSSGTMSSIAEWLRKTASNLQYVIYNHRIAGPGMGKKWRSYSGVNPHTDHVHADFFAPGGSGGGSAPTGSLAQWIAAGMAKAGVSGDAWRNGLNWIIQKESTGNPRAVGAPTSDGTAKGLMQLKHFNYKGNPFDPVNNIRWGIKYIQDRYKSIGGALSWWKSHNWYANGTNFHNGGSAVLGDGGVNEPFLLPNGQLGISPNIPTLFSDLPRGTVVFPSVKDLMKKTSNSSVMNSNDNSSINITLNYSGSGTQQDALQMINIVKDALRREMNEHSGRLGRK